MSEARVQSTVVAPSLSGMANGPVKDAATLADGPGRLQGQAGGVTDNPQNPLVSVVIVSWNARRYLEQCLTSLTPDVCRCPMEIIVVDNASNDGSPEAVAEAFPHVRLIRNASNLGFGKANNVGIRQSRGRFVCLVNSDVKVLPNCITRLVDYCETHPEVGMVGPRVYGGDGLLQRSCRGFPGVWNMFCRALALDVCFPRVKAFCGYALCHWAHDTEADVDILSGCFWLARREALDRVGLLDESFFMYGEDMDWCRRFWSGGWKLRFVPAAEAIHYGGASSANAPVRFAVEMQKADLQYWRKHHSVLGVAGYFLTACLNHIARATGFTLAGWLRPRQAAAYAHKVKMATSCLAWLWFGTQPAASDSQGAAAGVHKEGFQALEKIAG